MVVAPFKIAGPVIGFILIYMIYAGQAKGIWHKCFSYHSVDKDASAMGFAMYRTIASRDSLAYDTGCPCMHIINAHHPTQITNFIKSFVTDGVLPNLLHSINPFYF